VKAGLIIDNFAGGGGASTGIEAAMGRIIDVAINHDPEAIAMHKANHPATFHYCQSVWRADPLEVTGGRPVALAWFSPDCKHFSKAKGGKPVAKNIRDLAWIVVLWAQRVRPAVIMLENVEEFRTWGPLAEDGRPCPDRRGQTFDKWVKELRKAGYKVQWRELRACDYGAPTSRKRLFLIARCDGEAIVWPAPTHGKPGTPGVLSGKLKPWRTAAEIIDWSIACPSIFTRKRDLREATLRRIAHGVMKFVVNNPRPFIVPVTHTSNGATVHSADEPLRTITTAKGGELAIVGPTVVPLTHHGDDARGYDPADPLPTVTGAHRGEMGVVEPFVVRVAHGDDGRSRVHPLNEPLGTQPASNEFAVVAPTFVGCGGRRGQSGPVDPAGPFPTQAAKADACLVAGTLITMGYGERPGQEPRVPGLDAPARTIVSGGGKHGLVAALLSHQYGSNTNGGRGDPREPAKTIMTGGHHAVVAAHLERQFGRSAGAAVDAPAPTITAGGGGKTAIVAAHIEKFSQNSTGTAADAPIDTVMAGAPRHAVVAAHMEQANTGMVGRGVDAPLSTIVSRGTTQRLIETTLVEADALPPELMERAVMTAAFLIKYYGNEPDGHGLDRPMGTVTTKDRFAVITVTIDTLTYILVDIGMRMLSARELFRAQSFPDSYIIDPIFNGKPLTKTSQIAKCGNSVPPVMSEALVRANLGVVDMPEKVAA